MQPGLGSGERGRLWRASLARPEEAAGQMLAVPPQPPPSCPLLSTRMGLPGRAGDFAGQENPWASLAAVGSCLARPGHRGAPERSVAGHISGSPAEGIYPADGQTEAARQVEKDS